MVLQAAALGGWNNVEPWSPSMTVSVPPGFKTAFKARKALAGSRRCSRTKQVKTWSKVPFENGRSKRSAVWKVTLPIPARRVACAACWTDCGEMSTEVICASGWALARYLKNPVFQDSHDYSTILRTIGKAVVTEVRGNRLYQRISFAVDANPLARIAHAMYRGGFLNAVSVGFIPLEWENGGAGSGFARRYLKQELVETSAVAIPANPNALECAVKAGAVGKSEIGELMDILRWLSAGAAGAERENFAGAGFNAGAPESGTNGAQLVQLMREVAAIHRRA